MNLNYNVSGKNRKELVTAISEITGIEAKYAGVPSCAYRIGEIEVGKTGTVTGDERQLKSLKEKLSERGFACEEPEAEAASERTGIAIQMPMLDEAALQNLKAIIESKSSLIKKAFGTDALPVEEIDGKLDFAWLLEGASPEKIRACMNFITKLCEMAKTQKRVTAKEKETDNDKYAFRCFLLRLGFIGDEYKADRKVLLKNLTGSSAFKSGKKGGDAQ